MDGKPAEIHLIGDCMLGVMLTEGQHLVEYTYKNAAFALGWKISLLCAVIFGTLVYKTTPTKKRGRFQR